LSILQIFVCYIQQGAGRPFLFEGSHKTLEDAVLFRARTILKSL